MVFTKVNPNITTSASTSTADFTTVAKSTMAQALTGQIAIDRPEPRSIADEISFLRLPGVRLATGLSKSSIYALIRANGFPAPVPLGLRMVGWVRSEVQDWAAERVRLRDAA